MIDKSRSYDPAETGGRARNSSCHLPPTASGAYLEKVGRYANAGFLGRLARELGQTKAYAASPDRPINGGHRDADASGVCRFAVVVYAENLRRAVRIVKDSCPGSAVAIAFRFEPIQFFAAGPAPTDMTIPKASEKLGSGVGATAARLVRRRFLGLY